MKIQLKKLFILMCLATQSIFSMQQSASIYNNAKLIFHAVGPKFTLPGLEGIDPSVSTYAMESTLASFTEKNKDLSANMRDCIARAKKSLARARANYLVCIGLVNLSDKPKVVDEMAMQLSHDVKKLVESETYPSILFIGGHYLHPKGGSLGGHTASYEAIRQENGKLSFIVNNTVKTETHTIDGNRIDQLIYNNLEETDLDKDFWENVIQTNYMNPVKGRFYMESFYDYLDRKLNKGSNKTVGRSYKCQEKGVCAWKAISVWLHGKISPGKCNVNRVASLELAYVQYKRCLFENMLVNFKPDASLNEQTAASLKTELERKIKKMDEKSKLLSEGKIPPSSTNTYFSLATIWKWILGN